MYLQPLNCTLRYSSHESESHLVGSISLRPHRLYSPWNSPAKNTGVGSLSLLQGIFPTQGSNPGLQHCRQILYQLSHKGSPRRLEWIAFPSPVDLPDPGIEPGSPALQADSLTELSRQTMVNIACFILCDFYHNLKKKIFLATVWRMLQRGEEWM